MDLLPTVLTGLCQDVRKVEVWRVQDATCAITLNAVRSILLASPGLKTMGQIPPIAFFNEAAV